MFTKKYKRIRRFLEFFLVGLIMGIIEDLIAIKLTTGANITMETVWIAGLIALPFAVFSELIVDRPKIWPDFLKKRLIPENKNKK